MRVILPDDPEAAEGYGPGVPIERDSGGTLDPYMVTTSQVMLMNAFRGGTPMPFQAILGSTPGNRIPVTAPAARAPRWIPVIATGSPPTRSRCRSTAPTAR